MRTGVTMKYPAMNALAAMAMSLLPQESRAAALQVAPVLVEVAAPSATSSVTLRNEGMRPLDTQVRVFKWSQVNGVEKLEPTRDVVASPPSATLDSRTDYTIRVVRTAKTPVEREEAYRLVVDELPDPARERNGTVVVVVRHAIPVFFTPVEANMPKVTWSVQTKGNQLVLTAVNAGGRRVRLSNMTVSDGKSQVHFGSGLVGYSLAGASMSWTRPMPKGFSASNITISAQGDLGKINAVAQVQATPAASVVR